MKCRFSGLLKGFVDKSSIYCCTFHRTYKIACNGTGIQPALQLSNNVISFAATALDNTSTATLAVHNPKISKLSSAVIRGVLLPQGPKMFEFAVPAGCPVTVSPQVGKVPLGEVS